MVLTVGIWLCAIPFALLLLGPWLGPKGALGVAALLGVGMAIACWMLCVTRDGWSVRQGGGLS